jgi:4-phytase/acid phosphatase
MQVRPWSVLLVSAALAFSTGAGALPPRLERVVVVMRHGVRPPTREPPLPAGTAVAPWPRWPVPPGELTPHGAAAVRLLGVADRRQFATDGLLPAAGCPAPGTVEVVADSDIAEVDAAFPPPTRSTRLEML